VNNAYKIIEEISNKWEEHLEHMNEEDAYVFFLNAIADIAMKERDRANRLQMDLRRCEISRR